MAFIGFLVFWAISFVAGQLLRAVTAKPENAKPETPDQPRTEEGGQIPVVFGTQKLGPTVVWWGDVKAVPVKKRVATSLFTSKKQTIAYKYLVGMQGALCWGPVDEVVDIILGEKKKLSEVGAIDYRKELAGLVLEFTATGVSPSLPLAYAAGGTAVTLDAPFVFGGPEKGGGVAGTLRVYFGSGTQTANSYLTTQTATTPFPTYRGLCYAVWEQVDCGQSARIEPWQFVVRRCPGALGVLAGDTALSRIGDDANPAEVLYELWTDTRWGLGESATALDTDSFLAALQTLSSEGLGVSGTLVGGGSADEKAKEILRTIDGVLVTDPLTGKLRLKLIRADYAVDDLEVFTPSNSNSLTTSRPDWDELTTEVKVRYTDTSLDFTTRARPAYNPAVRQALGKARGVTVDYPLITTGENAGILALRDLKALSSTLATGSVVLPRVGATLAPGDPFILDYPDDGLTSTVVRATRVNYGTINGQQAVECQWAEDVFGVTGGVFVTDPPDAWEPGTPPVFGNVVVIPTVTTSDTQTCVTLEFTGQVSLITLIEMQGQEGGGVATGWTAFDIDDPPTLCVDRDERLEGTIAYRVTVTEPDGTTDTIEDEIPVPPLGVDDGSGVEGTPGNFGPWTLQTTPPVVVRNVGADAYEPAAFKAFRKYHNTNKAGRLRIQLGNHRASGATVEACLMYSLDGGVTDLIEAGPTVRLDRVNFPEPGAQTALVAGAVGPNVLLGLGLKGGDGTDVVKIGDIYVDAVASTAPPNSPSGDPPEVGDVPQGGSLGTLILDLNAQTLLDNGALDLAEVDPWPDDTGITGDAGVHGFQNFPLFRTSGFGGGALPRVHVGPVVSDLSRGFITNLPTVDSCTFYFVIDVEYGDGTQGAGGTTGNASIMVLQSLNHRNGWVSVRTDETIQAGVNAGSFGNPSAVGATVFAGSGPHIVRFAWSRALGSWYVFVDGALECSVEGNPLVNGSNTWEGVPRIYYGNLVGLETLSADYGRVLCYDQPHVDEGMNVVELALRAVWGTP